MVKSMTPIAHVAVESKAEIQEGMALIVVEKIQGGTPVAIVVVWSTTVGVQGGTMITAETEVVDWDGIVVVAMAMAEFGFQDGTLLTIEVKIQALDGTVIAATPQLGAQVSIATAAM